MTSVEGQLELGPLACRALAAEPRDHLNASRPAAGKVGTRVLGQLLEFSGRHLLGVDLEVGGCVRAERLEYLDVDSEGRARAVFSRGKRSILEMLGPQA